MLLLLLLLRSPQGSIHARRAETGVAVPFASWSVDGSIGGIGARPRPIAASSGQRCKQLVAGDVRFNGRGGGGTHIGGSTRSAWNVATAVLATGWTVWQVVR